MTLPLVFSPEVREEVDEAYAWYERQRAGLGEEFLGELEAAVGRVRGRPGAPCRGLSQRAPRPCPAFPHAVYDRLEPDRVSVIAVHHGKRDPRGWRSRA
jgi:plasmid stabilization system protein ParE